MTTINDLGMAAMALVVAAFMIGIGASVLVSLNTTQAGASGAPNAATDIITSGVEGMTTFGTWIPIVAVVVAAVVVIGLLVSYLGAPGRGGEGGK